MNSNVVPQEIEYYHPTAAGVIKLLVTQDTIMAAAFVDEVPHGVDFMHDESVRILRPSMQGTPFQQCVWQATIEIPVGTTATYQEIAHKIGSPNAYRAVANALACNQIAYFIPCHRVIGSNGSLRGYKWGIARKAALLAAEKAKL